MYEFSLSGITFPVTPSKFKISINGNNKTIHLLSGEVNLIKTAGLSDISFDLALPHAEGVPYAIYPKTFRTSDYYLAKIKAFQVNGKPIRLKIIRTYGNTKLEDFNMMVTLEEYDISEDTSNGFEVVVSLQFKQYRSYGPKKITIKKDKDGKNKVKQEQEKRPAKDTAGSYVVKKGDSLWKIAKKECNDSSKSIEIYKLNQDAIEKDAKKNGKASSSKGHWIFSGLKLKLPK